MRIVKSLLAAVFLAAALTTAQAEPLKEGVHYKVLSKPLATEAVGKIEVVEFFSYGCSHCYQFETFITPWIKKLPKDVAFSRVPLVSGGWAPTGKLYFTLDSLGVEEKLRADVFAAIHRDRSVPAESDGAAWAAWAAKRGVDAKQFTVAYSFIGGKMEQAKTKIESLDGTGVPAIVVNGRYLVLSDTIKSWDDLLALTDRVVDMVRTSKSGKK